jgi:uncharacterized protein (TIGR00255 family)
MSARSMTGFARVRRQSGLGEVVATLKSVNHRALDLRFHLPAELDEFEPALRQAIKTKVARGHLDVRLAFIPAHATGAQALNRALFEAYLKGLEEAARDYGVSSPPDANAALRIPGMLTALRDGELPGPLEREILAAVEEAAARLNEFREREGAEIVRQLRPYNAAILRDAGEIESLRAGASGAFRARLEERLRELLGSAGVDPQRLAQEAAILADRGDIAEETGRLKVHAQELDQLLARGGEMGKKLDFLLQEMNREANTILSKTSGVGELGLKITALGLDVKANIEKIREQALNLE